MESAALDAIVGSVLGETGLDARHVFWRARRLADGTLRLEASEPRLLAAAAARLLAAQGCGVQTVPLPEPALAGVSAWVAASVAEVRRAPRHDAEQVTQALQGEVLQPFVHEDGWAAVRLPDGYVGWLRDWHLRLVPAAEPEAFGRAATARVAVPLVAVRCEPASEADPCGETLLGTCVRGLRTRGDWTEVELPGPRRGWLPGPALRAGTGPWPATVAGILATLRRFLGVPYLWGGRSPKGFDCSGLVQYAFALHGVRLPRDSDQQAACGVPVDTPAAGDLLFFGKERITHVAVSLDGDAFLHARGEVRCNALGPGSPGHDPELRGLWRSTRRVVPPGA